MRTSLERPEVSAAFSKGANDGAARQLSLSFSVCGQFQGARRSDVAAGAFPQVLLEEPVSRHIERNPLPKLVSYKLISSSTYWLLHFAPQALPSISRLEQTPVVDTQLQRASSGAVGPCAQNEAAIRDRVTGWNAASSRDQAPSDIRGAASDSQTLSSFGGALCGNVLHHQDHRHAPPQPLVQLVWGPSSGTHGNGVRALALASSALPRKQRAGEAPCDGECPAPSDEPASKRARRGSSAEAAGRVDGGMGTSLPPASYCSALGSTPALLCTHARPSVCPEADPGLSLAFEGPVRGAWRSTGYGTQSNATSGALCASAPVCRDQDQLAQAQCTRQAQQQSKATQPAGRVPELPQAAMQALRGPAAGGGMGVGGQPSCSMQPSGLPRQGDLCGTVMDHQRLAAGYDSVGLSGCGAVVSAPTTQLRLPTQLQLPSVPSLPTWLTHPLLLQPSYFTNPWVLRGLEEQAMAAQLQQQQKQQQKQQEGGQRLAELLKAEAWQQLRQQQQQPK